MSEEKPINERISVVETRIDQHEKRFDENQSILLKFFDRFDEHMIEDAKTNVELGFALTALMEKTDLTNETLKSIERQSDNTTKDVDKAKTIWETISKVVIVVSVVVSAVWAVYTFYYGNPATIESLSKIVAKK